MRTWWNVREFVSQAEYDPRGMGCVVQVDEETGKVVVVVFMKEICEEIMKASDGTIAIQIDPKDDVEVLLYPLQIMSEILRLARVNAKEAHEEMTGVMRRRKG